MSALLRHLCTRIDHFYGRHPLLAMLAAILVCFVCEIAIGCIGGNVVPPVIIHIGGFST
jgi:hypothetical protein